MKTREELLREKEEIEKQLKKLDKIKEYSKKIVILFNPDLTEGRIPFYSKKEFYIKERENGLFKINDVKKLIECIYVEKYGLYDSVMGSSKVLMDTFRVYITSVDIDDKCDSVFDMNKLSLTFGEALKQIEEFLETVPTKSNTRF